MVICITNLAVNNSTSTSHDIEFIYTKLWIPSGSWSVSNNAIAVSRRLLFLNKECIFGCLRFGRLPFNNFFSNLCASPNNPGGTFCKVRINSRVGATIEERIGLAFCHDMDSSETLRHSSIAFVAADKTLAKWEVGSSSSVISDSSSQLFTSTFLINIRSSYGLSTVSDGIPFVVEFKQCL